MNNFGIDHFSLFVIDTFLKLSYSFMLHLLIKSKSYQKFLSADFVFFTYFYFQHCLRKNITEDCFLKNKHMLLFDGLFLP